MNSSDQQEDDSITPQSASNIGTSTPNMGSLRPDPPTLADIANQISLEEDEVLAQAKAAALNAAKIAQQQKAKKQSLFMMNLNTNTDKEELPLGDIQQRKLIEEKLKRFEQLQQSLQAEQEDNKPLAGLVDVKQKLDSFIHESQQKIEESLSHFDITKSVTGSPSKVVRDVDSSEADLKPSSTNDTDVQPQLGQDGQKPTLSTIVYKRRSGYGKYSTKNPWERRRMDLVGNTIFYYKTLEEKKEIQQVLSDSSRPSSPFDVNDDVDHNNDKPKKNFWDQAKENITKTTETLTTSLITSNLATDPNAPRGSIDIVKENAIVAAISSARGEMHSTAMSLNMTIGITSVPPTPFGISIIVKNETKWKICFENQNDQVQWLSALTEIVVRNSVENYNEGLNQSRRGISITDAETRTGDEGKEDGEAEVNHIENNFKAPPGDNNGSKLWTLDQQYFATGSISQSNHEDPSTFEEEGSESITKTAVPDKIFHGESPLTSFHDFISNRATSGPEQSLSGKNIMIANVLFNIALKLMHSTSGRLAFLFYAIIANICFWSLVVDDRLKGKDDSRVSLFISIVEEYLYPDLLEESRKAIQNTKDDNKEDNTEDSDENTGLQPLRAGYKPILGSTTKQVEEESDSPEVNGESFVRWTTMPSQEVQVRGHGYLKSKQKIPSPSSLYEVIGCDVLNSDKRVSDFSGKVQLPQIAFDDEVEKTWNSPDVFIISLAVPTKEPSMTRPTTDGEGVNFVLSFKMKQETRKILRKITASDYDPSSAIEEEELEDVQCRIVNSVKLWEKWCTDAPNDESMLARFKFIPNVHNTAEIGLPSYIAKYCGKPVLIKRANVTGFLSSNKELSVMEFGISIHPFPYLAKKAMAYMKSAVFPKAIVSLSYVIEGRSDDELPEVLIGDSIKLIRPDPDLGVNFKHFLNGNAKSSIIAGTNDEGAEISLEALEDVEGED